MLEKLALSRNRLQTIEFMQDFPELRILVVSHNALTRIPGISTLKKLERLDASYNKLDNLGSEYMTLQNLVQLDVSHNCVKK